jgi:putative cell wall-binding protein
MKMKIQTSEPGRKGVMHLEATSLGDRSKNASVEAEVEFGIAVRGYDVDIHVPEKMTANKTYKGSFSIMLQVKEKVYVAVVTPPDLMVIPLTQMIEVTPKQAGIANFTMLASKPGDYPIIFRFVDSNGIPMPEEVTAVKVVEPRGLVILTGDDLLHSTLASLSSQNNKTIPVITVPAGKLNDLDLERLETFARIIILGNDSVVSHEWDKALDGIETDRIQGENLYESSWRFVDEMWQNGTSEVVLSTPKPVDIFRAYQIARMDNLPLVVSDGKMNAGIKSIMENMTKRDIALSKIVSVGEVDKETAKALQGLNISIEEVAV